MLVTFSSKAGADILMLSQHAKPLLQIMGKLEGADLAVRGVFMPEHMAQTIAQLEQAIAISPTPAEEDDDAPLDPIARPVGLRQPRPALAGTGRRPALCAAQRCTFADVGALARIGASP